MARQMTLYEVDVEGIVSRQTFAPGDFLIVRTRPGMSRADRVAVRNDFQRAVGKSIKVLTYEPDEIQVERLANPLRHPDDPRH